VNTRNLGRAGLVSAVLCISLFSAGCASSGANSSDTTLGDRRSITGEELAELPGANLYDVLQRARPAWLITSGARARSVNVQAETVVMADGRYFGTINSLRLLPVEGIRLVRYLTGSEAANVYAAYLPGRHVESVIIVEFGSDDPGDYWSVSEGSQ
jgi:hypothetical protein